MFGKLFGVPATIHESVVSEILQSQRIIIADLVAKNEVQARENQDLKATVEQAFRDLHEMRAAVQTIQPAAPPAGPPAQARKPAYANSSISGRHHLKRPEPKAVA